jgi:hypothetical protein
MWPDDGTWQPTLLPGLGISRLPVLGTSGNSPEWIITLCTFRSGVCLMATAYSYTSPRERAERPIFVHPDRELLGYRCGATLIGACSVSWRML